MKIKINKNIFKIIFLALISSLTLLLHGIYILFAPFIITLILFIINKFRFTFYSLLIIFIPLGIVFITDLLCVKYWNHFKKCFNEILDWSVAGYMVYIIYIYIYIYI